jgi:hypothetical protein
VIGEYDTNCRQPGPAHLYVTIDHDAFDCDARIAESVGNANAPQCGHVTWDGSGNVTPTASARRAPAGGASA